MFEFQPAEQLYLELSWRASMPADIRCVEVAATFCQVKDVRCETNLQQLWRQMFCSCRSEAVEQPSSWTATRWH